MNDNQINTEVIGKEATEDTGDLGFRLTVFKSSQDPKAEEALAQLHSYNTSVSEAIQPPYNFYALYSLFNESCILRPNVDSYVTNIDSFGHHFMPSIDLSTNDADNAIADALLYERTFEDPDPEPPTQKEVQTCKEELRRKARIEYIRLTTFFKFVCPDYSFTELRRQTRQDLEVTGNAYWEITRDANNSIVHLHYVKPLDIRLTELDKECTEVSERVKITPISWGTVKRMRKFRRFRLGGGVARKATYFKEFGDPRFVSRNTGKIYNTRSAFKKEEPGSTLATELIHFIIPSPVSPYGIPRWISAAGPVMGTKELDDVNLGFFEDGVIPPLALLCSGGRLGSGVATRIEEVLNDKFKGKSAFRKVFVIEAEGQKKGGDMSPATIPKIEFVPLRDAQQNDALFQQYDIRNEDKVSKTFRLPRILRGDDSKTNKATAFASLKFADEQVFEPEREKFDDIINRRLLPMLNARFWEFRSNAPIVRDPAGMTDMIERLVKVGILLPSEGRTLASDVFNRTFADISEEWTNKPLPLVSAQMHSGGNNLESYRELFSNTKNNSILNDKMVNPDDQ